MEEKDKKSFLILMAMLGEAFKEEVSTERAKIYFEFLKYKSLYDVMNGINQAIKELKFYPKLSELLDIIDPSHGQYLLIESEENKKIRLKVEEKRVIGYITQISKIIGKKREPDIKQLT